MMHTDTKTSSGFQELRLGTDDLPPPQGAEGADLLTGSWANLASGRARVRRWYSDAGRHYVELEPAHAPPLRGLDLLVPVLLGTPLKVVAADAHCSISTVASATGKCLRAMGLMSPTKDVPVIIVMMVHAFHRRDALRGLKVRCEVSEPGRTVLSVSRPESELDNLLSPCEREVMRRRIDGRTYQHIARERNTSVRTVANQIASACGKLRITGRFAVLGLLLGPGGPICHP